MTTLKDFIKKFFWIRLSWPIINYSDLDQTQKKIIAKEYLNDNKKSNNDKIFDEIIESI